MLTPRRGQALPLITIILDPWCVMVVWDQVGTKVMEQKKGSAVELSARIETEDQVRQRP